MLTYHSDSAVKQSFIEIAHEHERADSFVKGLYWQPEEKKGCSIGCWTKSESGNHFRLSLEMGVPVELLHLSDGIFEALPDPNYKTWSRKFAAAIPVGVDLSALPIRCCQWMLCDEEWGLSALAESLQLRTALKGLGRYFEERGGPEPLQAIEDLKQMVEGWKHWDEQALRDTRAARAALELWNAHLHGGPKYLAQAAWASRAAWSAMEVYTIAQSESLLLMLKSVGAASIYSKGTSESRPERRLKLR